MIDNHLQTSIVVSHFTDEKTESQIPNDLNFGFKPRTGTKAP